MEKETHANRSRMLTLERQLKSIEELRALKYKSISDNTLQGDLEMLANAEIRNQFIKHAVRHVQFTATKTQIKPLRTEEEL